MKGDGKKIAENLKVVTPENVTLDNATIKLISTSPEMIREISSYLGEKYVVVPTSKMMNSQDNNRFLFLKVISTTSFSPKDNMKLF